MIIEKLRNNYKLTKWLIYIFFIISFCLSQWWSTKSACKVSFQTLDTPLNVSYAVLFLTSLVSGAVGLLLLRLLVNLFIALTKLYSVPREEFALVTICFVSLGCLISGVLKLTYYITPALVVWGEILYPTIAVTVGGIFYYKTIEKNYLNTHNAPYFLKTLLIIYAIIMVVRVIRCI